jgi:chemotaxis response regulator CheB
MSIKVLLADDSEIVRRVIRDLLRSQPEIELVGEAVDFHQTIRMMNELNPQVFVLGFTHARRNRRDDSTCQISSESRLTAVGDIYLER